MHKGDVHMKGFRQLRFSDRLKIEQMIKAGCTVTEMARRLNVTRMTIYNEKKRGQYTYLSSEWETETRYSPDIAQEQYESNLTKRGTALKIGNDIEFANYIEAKICDEGYSPEAVIGELKVKGNPFKTMVCHHTIYNYIDKGVFLRLTNKDLPIKGKRKRKYKKIRRQARASAGTSIDFRDKNILNREEFGHWEMDSVMGSKKSRNAIIALTERKTRQEILFKANDHTAQAVVDYLDALERRWGKLFPVVFKSITVDNGVEFSFVDGMEKNGRTSVFYCHAYSSWERGSNENQNRMVRRKIPKGYNIDELTQEDIEAVEKWINNYPRKIFNYHNSSDLFMEEINRLISSA